MDFKDYRIADCTKVYYYAPNKQDILISIKHPPYPTILEGVQHRSGASL